MESAYLSKTIDDLTEKAFEKIAQNQFEDCAQILNERHVVILELVSLYPAVIDQESLSAYLTAIQQCDKSMIKTLTLQKQAMQQTLPNFNHIREYLKV